MYILKYHEHHREFIYMDMVIKKYLKWEEVNIKWESVDMTWEEVFIMIEVEQAVRGGSGGYSEYVKGNPWDKLNRDIGEEKTKKVIKLYCRVRGIDYEEIAEPRNDIKITVNEFERFVKEQIKIKIDL